jgi:hypothetical protein
MLAVDSCCMVSPLKRRVNLRSCGFETNCAGTIAGPKGRNPERGERIQLHARNIFEASRRLTQHREHLAPDVEDIDHGQAGRRQSNAAVRQAQVGDGIDIVAYDYGGKW